MAYPPTHNDNPIYSRPKPKRTVINRPNKPQQQDRKIENMASGKFLAALVGKQIDVKMSDHQESLFNVTLKRFDSFTIIVDGEGCEVMINKGHIMMVSPSKPEQTGE